jgi:hypothetical protein
MLRKKFIGRAAIAILAVLFAVVVTGCSTPNDTDNPSGPVALTGTVTIDGWITVNDTVIANVTGMNAGKAARIYKWQISDTEDGTYTVIQDATEEGYTPVETDEGRWLQLVVSANGYTGTKSSNKALVREEGAEPPTINTVTVSPKTVTVAKGGTVTFTADVDGTYPSGDSLKDSDKGVIWSVNSEISSITTDGELTVAANETAGTLTVTVKSAIDQTKTDTATVTVFTGSLVVTIPSYIKTGDTVTADHAAVEGVTYQWQTLDDFYIDNFPPPTITNILAATAKSYTTVDADETQYIRVVAKIGTDEYPSNIVYVRSADDPAPVVTEIEISTYNDDPAEVTKGYMLSLYATLTGTNLDYPSDQIVKWEVNSTTPGTYIDDGTLYVSFAETASTLTVKATSLITPEVYGTLDVTVNAYDGKSLTVSTITGLDGKWATVRVFSTFDEGEVAYGSEEILGGAVSFGLRSTSDYMSWTGNGEHWITLEVGHDLYIFTNGQSLNATWASNPKYNFTNAHSDIAFNLFKKIPLGEGGYELTINGFDPSQNGEEVELDISDFETYDTVAVGYGIIANGSVTVNLIDGADGISGWTDGGNYGIKLALIDGWNWEQYLYTDGDELDDLGITNSYDLDNAPKYTFTGAGPGTIAFSKFKILEFPYIPPTVTPITITGMSDLGEGTYVHIDLIDSYSSEYAPIQEDGSAVIDIWGWDGTGMYRIKLTTEGDIYVYTNGQTLDDLDVTGWDDLYDNLPYYNFDDGLEIAFSDFMLADLPLPTVTITGMGTDFEDEEWTIDFTDGNYNWGGFGIVTDGSLEFKISPNWDSSIWDGTGMFYVWLYGPGIGNAYIYIADNTLEDLGISTINDARDANLPAFNFSDSKTIDFTQFGGPLGY